MSFTVVDVAGDADCTGTIVSADLVAFSVGGRAGDTTWVDGPAEGAGAVGDTVVVTVGTLADIGSDVTIRVGRPTADTAATTISVR